MNQFNKRVKTANGNIFNINRTSGDVTIPIANDLDTADLDVALGASQGIVLRNITENLQISVDAIHSDLSGFSGRLTTAETEINTLNSEMGIVTGQVSSLATRTDNLESAVIAVNSSISGINSSISGLQTRMTTAETNISTLNSNVTSIDADLTTVEATVATQGTAITTLQGTVSSQGTAITALQSTVAGQTTDISTLQGTVASQGSAITSLSSTVSSQGSAITSLSSTVASQGSDITSLGSRMTTAEGNITSINGSITSINSTITNGTTGNSALGSRVTALESTSAGHTASISTLNGQMSTANTNIASNTSNIATNTSNIAANTSAISVNSANIITNTGNIATNTSAIAGLSSSAYTITPGSNIAISGTGTKTISTVNNPNFTTSVTTPQVVTAGGNLELNSIYTNDVEYNAKNGIHRFSQNGTGTIAFNNNTIYANSLEAYSGGTVSLPNNTYMDLPVVSGTLGTPISGGLRGDHTNNLLQVWNGLAWDACAPMSFYAVVDVGIAGGVPYANNIACSPQLTLQPVGTDYVHYHVNSNYNSRPNIKLIPTVTILKMANGTQSNIRMTYLPPGSTSVLPDIKPSLDGVDTTWAAVTSGLIRLQIVYTMVVV